MNMPEYGCKEIEQLKNAIGNRVDLPMKQLMEIMDKESEANNKKLNEYYEKNSENAEFIRLMDQKQFLEKNEFKQKEAEFLEKNSTFKDKEYQKKVFNEIFTVVPEGELLKVKGGYAVLKTERRHGRSPNGTFPVLADYTEENGKKVADNLDLDHTKGGVSTEDLKKAIDGIIQYMKDKTLYETNRYVGQGELAIPVKVITEKPMQAAFTINMFREEESESKMKGWVILVAPNFTHDDPKYVDGVFKFYDYERRIIVIGGSGYNGEVKKAMFSIANHMYPLTGNLSFHCSSVYDPESKEVTLVFGLSGTGKSTVASGIRTSQLLSDDETGVNLAKKETFNLENGNYYKTGGLLAEPKVLHALENTDMENGEVALYENVIIAPDGHVVFGVDPTANGRVSITLKSLEGAILGGMYPIPKRMIILSRDVNAILDPVNLLNREQIVYYLNLGYTSKTPGTESGITKPIPTYSKWEGGPFYDLKDSIVMEVLLRFLNEYQINAILLNSGEGGGPFGSEENDRFSVDVTLELARSFMSKVFMNHYKEHPEDFEENTLMRTIRPKNIPGISADILATLNAKKLWEENGYESQYDQAAKELFAEFRKNAEKSLSHATGDIASIMAAGPVSD